MTTDTGSIVTVDGPIAPEDLGVTITHEHVFMDLADTWFQKPSSAREQELARQPVSLDNLWYVHQHRYSNKDNLRIGSFDEAVWEIKQLRYAGGDALVDVTPKHCGGDPRGVRAVSLETGVHIVHGTAFYVRDAHPDRVDDMSVADIADEFVTDIREGIDETGIRAGIVGEIGLTADIHEQEEKVLRAGARAARRTGAPLTIHPPGRLDQTHPRSRWCLEVLDVIEEEGLPPERVIMGHLDGSINDELSYQHDIAERGAYVQYDSWGTERYLPHWNDSYRSDTWRVNAVVELVEAGYGSKLLFSQDIGTKSKRRTYAGPGYAHVVETVVPRLRSNGLSREQIDRILIDNPREILTFVEPS